MRYRVHYYDPKRKGTWFRYFADRSKAEEFAGQWRVYARPCRVEEVPDEGETK